MEVLHEYLLFASWEEYFHLCIWELYCLCINEYRSHNFDERDTSIRLNGIYNLEQMIFICPCADSIYELAYSDD